MKAAAVLMPTWRRVLPAAGTGALALALVGSGGCASIPPNDGPHGAFTTSHKVVLIETPMVRNERALRSQFAADLPAESGQSHDVIDDAAAKAEALALVDMRKALEQQKGLTVDDAAVASNAVRVLGLDDPDRAVTEELAQQLHAVTGADDLVRFHITDYGVTPRAWRAAYISFEVVSTLAIAAIAYSYPSTRGIAGIYLVQEAIEETAEGYAGFWAINEVCRPVRIEAQVVSLRTGTETWKGAVTGLSDIRLARIFRKVSAAEQDAQRRRATEEAAGKLEVEIAGALRRSDARDGTADP